MAQASAGFVPPSNRRTYPPQPPAPAPPPQHPQPHQQQPSGNMMAHFAFPAPPHHLSPSSPLHPSFAPQASMTPPPAAAAAAVSRNDLFNTSWSPELPPPRPLAQQARASSPRRTPAPLSVASLPPAFAESRAAAYAAATSSSYRYRRPTTPPPFMSPPTSPSGPTRTGGAGPTAAIGIPGASGSSAVLDNGPMADNSAPPPGGSKTSSFFESAAADTPPPAPRLGSTLGAPSPLSLSRASSLRARALPSLPSPPPPLAADDDDIDRLGDAAPSGLSPLHQSPSLPPTNTSNWVPPRPPAADHIQLRLFPEQTYLLGEGRYARVYLSAYKREGMGPEWTLAAAKRLAPDRESQTMGLREAFFLNRLGAMPARASSPLRSTGRKARNGRVYVVKLIAVKEASETPSLSLSAYAHTRSASDQIVDGPPTSPTLVRQRPRSSTIYASNRQESGSHPNLPQLAYGDSPNGGIPSPGASASRLVLVLEHAPLGTLDRLLRTSPALVGDQLWGRWAREAAEALEWVHSRGVVHADVKPSNLLLTADLHLRLSDFGSSLLVHPAHPPTDGVGLGTLPFSPPELVDPTKPFSFPVDVFSLGATLYQCITGREPYRGSRPVEMILHVRNGGLWAWEENERLGRIGTADNTPATSALASPYPSAWHDDAVNQLVPSVYPDQSLRRAGSLRVPMRPSRGGGSNMHGPLSTSFERPRLNRVGSAESIKASDDVVAGDNSSESPSAIKLWHNWVKGGGGAHRKHGSKLGPIERLLRSDDEPPSPPMSPSSAGHGSATGAVSRSSSLRSVMSRAPSLRSPTYRNPTSPTGYLVSPAGSPTVPCPLSVSPTAATTVEPSPAYSDGAPAMFFLGGDCQRVPDDVRDVIRAMLDPVPEMRPTASDVVGAWDQLCVGVDENEDAEGED